MNTESEKVETIVCEPLQINNDMALKRKEYNKKYYSQNKGKIIDQLMKVVTCNMCGCTVTHQHLQRHQKTKICAKRALKKNTILA